MSMSKLVLVAAAIFGINSATASANVVLEEQAFGPASTNWGASSSSSSFTPTQHLGFAGFNSSLGTLTSVGIAITENITGTVNITNNGVATTGVDASLLNRLKVSLPSLATVTLLATSDDLAATLASQASTGPQSVLGSESTSVAITSPAGVALYATAWSAVLGDLGNVTVSADNSNGSAAYTDFGQAVIEATYTYTPAQTSVPEPATLTLFGTSLLGFSRFRRRSR